MEQQTKIQPGDLVFTHPQDNPEHIKDLPSYTHVLYYLVLSEELAPNRCADTVGHQSWYKIMSTSRITGDVKVIKLPENMLSKYEELL
tara:strand:- start:465 stop:728 length:264 start_codon:yes stop_codon:yes gene_type:complete